MTAEDLVRQYGRDLIGRKVRTIPIGDWTGGICTVTDIEPDGQAPEIVFSVRRDSDGEETGVFDEEPCEVVQ